MGWRSLVVLMVGVLLAGCTSEPAAAPSPRPLVTPRDPRLPTPDPYRVIVGVGCSVPASGTLTWLRVYGPARKCGTNYEERKATPNGGIFYRWAIPVDYPGHCGIDIFVPDTLDASLPLVRYAVFNDGTKPPTDGFVINQAKHRGEWVHAGSFVLVLPGIAVRMDNKSSTPGWVIAGPLRFTCHRN